VHYADLDLAAVAQRRDGRDRQLALWYALRARDGTGTGHISRDQVQDAARWLGWSTWMTALMLRSGEGIFWTVAGDGTIYVRSAAKVARALGVRSFRSAFRASLRDLRGPLIVTRARLVLQAIAALRDGRPIANATIAKMVGVDVRTVRRWRRLARVRSRENYMLIAPLSPGQAAADFRRCDPALRTVRHKGRRWIARRLPDSFQTPKLGGRSRLRRANRHLRRLTGAASSVSSAGGSTRRRVYAVCRKRRGAAAALPSLPVCHALTPLGGAMRSRRPVRVWGGAWS